MDHNFEQRSYHVYEILLAHILSFKYFLGFVILSVSIRALDIILLVLLHVIVMFIAFVLPLFDQAPHFEHVVRFVMLVSNFPSLFLSDLQLFLKVDNGPFFFIFVGIIVNFLGALSEFLDVVTSFGLVKLFLRLLNLVGDIFLEEISEVVSLESSRIG